jgi:hypothetical protein
MKGLLDVSAVVAAAVGSHQPQQVHALALFQIG